MERGHETTGNDSAEFHLPTHVGMERHLRALHGALAKQNFKSIDEVNAFIAKNFNGKALDKQGPGNDPKERAQWLADEAFETTSRDEPERLALEALKLDPDCVDAHNILGGTTSDTKKAITHFRNAAAAGEHTLGAEFIADNKGRFWGVIETRPYMRALEHLAYCCWHTGQGGEAVALWERMLDLNPNDNQGVRERLLSVYLQFDEREHADKLLDRFKDDGMCVMAWGRVIHALRFGDDEIQRHALRKAMNVNAHVPGFLLGMYDLPERPPFDGVVWGSLEEAQLSMLLLVPMIPKEEMSDLLERLAALLMSMENELKPSKRPSKRRRT